MSKNNRQQPRKDTKVSQDQNQPQAAASEIQQAQTSAEGETKAAEQVSDTAGAAEPTAAPTEAPTPEPTQAPTPEPTPEPTAAPAAPVASEVLREKTEFEQYLDAVRANGSPNLVNVLDLLEAYQSVMGLNTVTSVDTINQQQGALWRAIRMVINSAEDFEKGFLLLVNFCRHYSTDGAFQHHLLFRGFEHTKLNADSSRAFQNVLTIITTAADHKNKDMVRKNIDLGRALNSPAILAEARMRIIGYFN